MKRLSFTFNLVGHHIQRRCARAH